MVSKNMIEKKLRSDAYSAFISDALRTSTCTTAVFINKALSGSLERSPLALSRKIVSKSGPSAQRDEITELPATDRSHRIFMPFFGGADGQAALNLVFQLAENPEITVTVVHYRIRAEGAGSTESMSATNVDGKIRVSTSFDMSDDDFFVSVQQTLPYALANRITFRTIISYDPVQDAVTDAQNEVGQNDGNGGDLIVLGRNADIVDPLASSCLGLVADVILEKDLKVSVVIVQAKKE